MSKPSMYLRSFFSPIYVLHPRNATGYIEHTHHSCNITFTSLWIYFYNCGGSNSNIGLYVTEESLKYMAGDELQASVTLRKTIFAPKFSKSHSRLGSHSYSNGYMLLDNSRFMDFLRFFWDLLCLQRSINTNFILLVYRFILSYKDRKTIWRNQIITHSSTIPTNNNGDNMIKKNIFSSIHNHGCD